MGRDKSFYGGPRELSGLLTCKNGAAVSVLQLRRELSLQQSTLALSCLTSRLQSSIPLLQMETFCFPASSAVSSGDFKLSWIHYRLMLDLNTPEADSLFHLLPFPQDL